jgi:glycerophosphoryl diester phosphodiesterase
MDRAARTIVRVVLGLIRAALPMALAVIASAAVAADLKQLNGEPPIVIAHRGASGYLPEHTLAGYELAVKLCADYIEPDLQLTKDGVLVAMHDDTLIRTTDAQALFPGRSSYAVAEFTLREIETLTVRPVGTASTAYPGFTPVSAKPFGVPTFQEVIMLARRLSASTRREIGIYPEAKQADPVMQNKILETLLANGYKGTDKVFIQSFSIDTVKGLHDQQARLGADFKLLLLSSSSTALVGFGLANIKSFADGVGVSITGPGMSASFIDQAHAAGLLVHGYTFSKTGSAADAQYQQFYGWGIDGVFSNHADLALASRAAFLSAAALAQTERRNASKKSSDC